MSPPGSCAMEGLSSPFEILWGAPCLQQHRELQAGGTCLLLEEGHVLGTNCLHIWPFSTFLLYIFLVILRAHSQEPSSQQLLFLCLNLFFLSCQVFDCLRDSRDKYLSPSRKKLRFSLLSSHSVAFPVLPTWTADHLQWVQSPAVGWSPPRKGCWPKKLPWTPHGPV